MTPAQLLTRLERGDIASAYLFLMQQAFATGQTLIVDGGATLV